MSTTEDLDLFANVPTSIDRLVAGVDEVGRGPLAGPVVAGAVVLNPDDPIADLADSKELTHDERVALEHEIQARAIGWALGRAEVEEIDRFNILRATLLAMRRAVANLQVDVSVAYIDGNIAPTLDCATVTVIGGDRLVPAISAASIIAKVARDEEMIALAEKYPEYGFDKHKGYATREHLLALDAHGPSEIHRRSFAPMRKDTADLTIPMTFA